MRSPKRVNSVRGYMVAVQHVALIVFSTSGGDLFSGDFVVFVVRLSTKENHS
jgi:hypothetical protein